MADIPMIEAHGLTKRYGQTLALDRLDLVVPQGAILGVLGPNGAGKSTAVRILTTLDGPRQRHGSRGRLRRGWRRSIGAAPHRCHRAGRHPRRSPHRTPNLVMVGRLERPAPIARPASERSSCSPASTCPTPPTAPARILRRHATPARSGRRPHDPAAGDFPRRADDRPRSHQPGADVGSDPRAGRRRSDPAPDHPVPGRGRRARRRIVVIDHGRAIALGTATQLKAQVGGARLDVTLTEPDPAAAQALSPFVTGEVNVSHDGRRLRAPVNAGSDLATNVVRASTRRHQTDNVDVHQPSLDDVFFALTGHAAEDATELRTPDRRLGASSCMSSPQPNPDCREPEPAPAGRARRTGSMTCRAHRPQPGAHRPRAAPAVRRDHPAGAVHPAVRVRVRLRRRPPRRRQLRRLRRSPACSR